jgi:rRNA maturation endonuclease Nob1
MSFAVSLPERAGLTGVRVLEVICEGCSEPIEYSTLEDVGECPECGNEWRLHL